MAKVKVLLNYQPWPLPLPKPAFRLRYCFGETSPKLEERRRALPLPLP
jgi:hypothetical protein